MSEAIKPSPDRLQKWLRRLHAPDEVLRVHAAMRLTAPGVDASDALPALQQALADPDPDVRQVAGWVLARLPAARRAA
ncbi:MAG: HEAT repeat domain-containing protein [Gemmataceae bacterium]